MFGAVKITKNADTDKYVYSGYGIGFNWHSEFLLSDGSIFFELIWAHLHIDPRKHDISILGIGPTQGLDDNTLKA